MRYPGNLLFILSISYVLFAIILWHSKVRQGLRLFDDKGPVSNRRMLILLHISGIILFSIPLFLGSASSIELFGNSAIGGPSAWVSPSFFVLVLLLSPRIAKGKFDKLSGNEFTKKIPGIIYIIFYFILRILFISVYEIWFRGFLLNASILVLGPVLAILLNTILYMLLHIVNGKNEVIACIPFGILLCCLCICQRAVWPAILIHLALTIPFEMYFLKNIKTINQNTHEDINNRSFGLSR